MHGGLLEQRYWILTGVLDYIRSGPGRLHSSQRGGISQNLRQIREMNDRSAHRIQQVPRPGADEILQGRESHNHESIPQQAGAAIMSYIGQYAIDKERFASGLLDCADPLNERFTR
jgi:hypothetical protein